MGHKSLLKHFHQPDWPYEIADPKQEISLGSKTLQFIETRMLHWPDSMFTYVKEDKLLFSSDAFGQHLASSERFDDEVNQAVLLDECTKYYANILLLFSKLIRKLLQRLADMELEIKMIAPDHGIIWRKEPEKILAAYQGWCNGETNGKVLVIYDTMWKSTEKMAKEIAAGVQKEGVSVNVLNLRSNHRSDIMTEVLAASAVILGSATLNNGMMPRMAALLTYMRGLKPLHKIGAAFGSFGWSGEAVKLLNEEMNNMKFNLIDEGLKIKYVPETEELQECTALGTRIAQAVKIQHP
jgi:flavorubredoxin